MRVKVKSSACNQWGPSHVAYWKSICGICAVNVHIFLYANVYTDILYGHVYDYHVWVWCISLYLWQLPCGIKEYKYRFNSFCLNLNAVAVTCVAVKAVSIHLFTPSFFGGFYFSIEMKSVYGEGVWASFPTSPSITSLSSMMLFHAVITSTT